MSNRTGEPRPFEVRMRVGLDDVDHVQVLYYPRVAHICCVAMDEFFRERLGLPWPQMIDVHRVAMPTVELQITYRRPLKYGDEFVVFVTVAELAHRKATFGFELRHAGTGETTHTAKQTTVFVDRDTWRAIPIPDPYRTALEAQVGPVCGV